MKKVIYSLLFACAVMLSSCEAYTDIQPKGMNLLSTTNELEMLLNAEIMITSSDMREVAADVIYGADNIPTLLSNPAMTRHKILVSLDDSQMDLLGELTASDGDYTSWYRCIGRIANPVLLQVDAAEGPESVKKQLKAEALTIRAYFHWLLVNKFAKAYNPATAATDPGIPYIKEDWDLTVPSEKLSVQKVYENIIQDINDAISLNALPSVNINLMRMNKAAAYAVKALALISMQDYTQAASAAKEALAENGNILNYNTSTTMMQGVIMGGRYPVIFRQELKCPEDYFYIYDKEIQYAMTPETIAFFEPGHACASKIANFNLMFDNIMDYGAIMLGLPGYKITYDMTSGWNQSGLKSTHMYLILAECAIHEGEYDTAMEYLDQLRVNRIDPAQYAPLKGTVSTEEDAILYLKKTSHGECLFSIYNFIQKKRWNELDNFKQSWHRDIFGTPYSIEPGSPLWIFPFPMNAVSLNPNLLPHNYKAAK
ncbi:MAG: RagB/SusD family nutrient uptake outer membrane protein [Bacteroidales bacterium]|nr:RagB/SusD family nutrient uptake outer membrane protein [Bacteroidales bacterium]